MNAKILCFALLACAALALGGCQQAGVKTQAPVQEVASEHITYVDGRAKLVVGNKDLVGKIILSGVKFGQVGKLTRSAVTIQNLDDAYHHIEYNIEWFDKEGFPVESFSAWQQADLTPHMLLPLQFVGKNPKAWGYILNIRGIGTIE